PVVVEHLVDRRGVTQMTLAQLVDEGIQRLVRLDRVTLRITAGQVIVEPIARDQPLYRLQHLRRIPLQIAKRLQGGLLQAKRLASITTAKRQWRPSPQHTPVPLVARRRPRIATTKI